MKASCIQHPANESLVIVRAWQMAFCNGNGCAATLLSYYEYWHNIKIAMVKRNKKANDIAEMHGDPRRQDESLLQFHTYDEIGDGIAHLYGRSSLVKANKELEALGVISVYKNPNPRYQFDKTRYVLFHPDVCQRWLDARQAPTSRSSIPTGSDPTPSPTSTEAPTPTQAATPTLTPTETLSKTGVNEDLTRTQHCDLDAVTSADLPPCGSTPTLLENQQPKNAIDSPTFDCNRQTIEYKPPITETTKQITQEIIKKTTTKQQQGIITSYTSPPPADMPTLTEEDEHLGATLTSRQQTCVEVVAQRLSPQVANMTLPSLVQHLAAVLVDKHRLSKANDDFRKKLNTLAKLIRQQRWQFGSPANALPKPATSPPTSTRSPPTSSSPACSSASPPPPPSSSTPVTREALLENLRVLESEQRHWQRMMNYSDKPEYAKRRAKFQQFLAQTEQKLVQARQALQIPTTFETRTTS